REHRDSIPACAIGFAARRRTPHHRRPACPAPSHHVGRWKAVVIMPKRRPTIPIAHADPDDLPAIAFTDEQWQAIERAYARRLNADVRQQITTVTTQYLKDCVFERTVAPKAMARERIEGIRRAAGDLEKVMFSASIDDELPQRAAGAAGAAAERRNYPKSSRSSRGSSRATNYPKSSRSSSRATNYPKEQQEQQEQQQSAHSYADGLIRRHLDERRWRADGALRALVTVTDGDGDTTKTSTGIGDAIFFQDDGLTAGIAQGAPTMAHDETAGIDADADDTTAAAGVALFNDVRKVSGDLSPTGYAQYPHAVGRSIGRPVGADQEGGTTAFSLAVSAAGVDFGLDTTDGTSIFLFEEGDLVVGRIGGAAGTAAFAVAINSTSGVVSVARYASIKYPTPGARDKLRHFRHTLKSLVVACDGALNDLSAAEYCDDEPWNWWIQGLTRV